MQHTCIMAFRKRLKKRGYSDISIFKIQNSDKYLVKAVEPLASAVVSREYSLIEMHNAFKF